MLIILEGLDNGIADKKYIASGYKLLGEKIEEFTLSSSRPRDYENMLATLNDKVLKHISTKALELIWSNLVSRSWLTNFHETILLNVLKGLSNKSNFVPDIFLKRLLSNTIDGATEFRWLYHKMNDWGGPNNFSQLILRLLLIWKGSSYVKHSHAAFKKFDKPANLAYKQKKILGFRFDDYDFEFEQRGNILVEIEPGIRLPNNALGTTIINNILQKEELYHPFFPITITELDESENENLKLETTVPIPAFYLKAFDDKGAWENFEKGVWLAVDIISTATGVGNLVKIRHLLKLKSAYVYLKLAFGILEVASGVVAIALNFVDKCEDKAFCNALRQYLFWFEICTLSADTLTTRILSKQAREAKDALVAYRKQVKNSKKQKDLDQLEEHLDKVSELNIEGKGLYGGKVLTKTDLDEWKKFLKRKFGKDSILAQFDPNTNTIKYKKGATEYFISHESFHAEEMYKLGFDSYVENAHITGSPWTIENRIHQYKREKHVYERIQENLSKFNKEEAFHSYLYFDTIKSKLEKLLAENNIPFPN